ncbi:MAG: hypothetical protein R3C18_17345 [Planctomycetaceae bacterium]
MEIHQGTVLGMELQHVTPTVIKEETNDTLGSRIHSVEPGLQDDAELNRGTEIFDSGKVRLLTPVTDRMHETDVPPSHTFFGDSTDAPYGY